MLAYSSLYDCLPCICCDAFRRSLLCVRRSADGSNLPNYSILGVPSSEYYQIAQEPASLHRSKPSPRKPVAALR